MRCRIVRIMLIILCASGNRAIGSSSVVALDEQIRNDLMASDGGNWEFKADSNRIEFVLTGLRSITNGMHKTAITALIGDPDRKVRAPDKAAMSVRGTSQYDYYIKKKRLNGANVNDWILSISFTNGEALDYILYQRDGRVTKIDGNELDIFNEAMKKP